MLPPPDQDQVRAQSVQTRCDVNTLTPGDEVIHVYRDDDEPRILCQQLLIARTHEHAPFGKGPREANIVLAGLRQTGEFVSGEGDSSQIAFHGVILLKAVAPARIPLGI